MRVGITGASGLVGGGISREAKARGHTVVAYSRSPDQKIAGTDEVREFREDGDLDLSGLDAVVHLAGEPVLGRWTESKKRKIRESRVASAAGIAAALGRMENPPGVFLCASGTGYYGDRGDEALPESASAGEGFLASVCVEWEAAARTAPTGVRVVHLRTAMVLAKDGGAAPLMARAFRLCLGGRLGSGNQFMPWIHLDDLAGLAVRALEDASVRGPVNGAAPEAVTNREFTRTLARVVSRPAPFPVPAALLKLLAGDLSEMLLNSQRVIPAAAADFGFAFRFPELDGALRAVLDS